jgi:hypothetical protein
LAKAYSGKKQQTPPREVDMGIKQLAAEIGFAAQ